MNKSASEYSMNKSASEYSMNKSASEYSMNKSASEYRVYIKSFNVGRNGHENQTLELTSSWWAMYYEDLKTMKQQILECSAKHSKSSMCLSNPRSVNILNKIILIRAVGDTCIKVKGVIDKWFLAAALAPETKKHHTQRQSFRVSYIESSDEFYTKFRLSSLKGIKKRESADFQHTDFVSGLQCEPIVKFCVAGFSRSMYPMHVTTNQYSSLFFDRVVAAIMSHKGQAKLIVGERESLIWRIELHTNKPSVSISLFNGIIRNDNVVKNKTGISKCDFFLIGYNGAIFIHHMDDIGEHHDFTTKLFVALEENKVIFNISALIRSRASSYSEERKLERYLMADCHILDAHYYQELKDLWTQSRKKTSFKNAKKTLKLALKDLRRDGDVRDADEDIDTRQALDFADVAVQCYTHAIKTLSQDNAMKNAVLYFEEQIESFHLKDLKADTIKFNICIKTELKMTMNILCVKNWCQKILCKINNDQNIIFILSHLFDALTSDALKHDDDFALVKARVFVSGDYVIQPYKYVFFKKSKNFIVKTVDNVVQISMGNCDLNMISIIFKIIKLLNYMYRFSLEHTVADNRDLRGFFSQHDKFNDYEQKRLIVVMLSYHTIIKWFKYQFLGGEFDHRAAINGDIAKQLPLILCQKKHLKENKKAFEKSGYYNEVKYVTSLTMVFGEEE